MEALLCATMSVDARSEELNQLPLQETRHTDISPGEGVCGGRRALRLIKATWLGGPDITALRRHNRPFSRTWGVRASGRLTEYSCS